MLRPSYSDLLEVLNKDANDENAVGSRYTIVIAAAKRARQLTDHAEPLSLDYKVNKPVSIAVQELYEGKIEITQSEPAMSEEEALADLQQNELINIE